MIKLRQDTGKLGKAAHAARLAQIQAAAAQKRFEVAKDGSRTAKRAFKMAKKVAKKAKRAARKADKVADRAMARVVALRSAMERAEKKAVRSTRRGAKTVASPHARSRIPESAPAAPDLGVATTLVPADSVSNN
jgi:hypothetical protein